MNIKEYDFVATHKPANITAQRVISKGFYQEHKIKDQIYHSDLPLKIYKTPKGDEDFTGKKYGDLQVIGFIREKRCGSKNYVKASWLVKCVCGKYETRRSKSIKKSLNDCCRECSSLRALRYKASKII